MPSKDSPEASFERKSLFHCNRGEKLSAMSHTLRFINLMCSRTGTPCPPLRVDGCVPCLAPAVPEIIQVSPLPRHRGTDTVRHGKSTVLGVVHQQHADYCTRVLINRPLSFSVFLSEYNLHRGPLFTVSQRVTLRGILLTFSSWVIFSRGKILLATQ